MVGLGAAGLGARPGGESNGPVASVPVSSWLHFSTIAWLRWRLFVNSFRTKGAKGELISKIISYPILAGIVFGPSIGSGIASWYFVHRDRVSWLALPLWGIFLLWQLVALSMSTTGPSFDLSSLIRFPLRYRDYLLIRLSFGMLDPPTIAGVCCLLAMGLGIGIANPALLPAALVVLPVYGAANIFFSRMIFSWAERWLAQRRAREILTAVILLFSLGMQFVGQLAGRFGEHARGGHIPQISPIWVKTLRAIRDANWFLPPGAAASAIDHVNMGQLGVALAAWLGLTLYAALFLTVLHLRLHAEYRGESLSEAPAAGGKVKLRKEVGVRRVESGGSALGFLPATVAANLVKEIRYLARSGPKLYVLVMPVFVTFLISVRGAGMEYAGLPGGMHGMLFAYGCAYMQLIFVALFYNSLGSDGAGVQFYFLAPTRMRDVMLSKNLLTFTIFTVEAILIYVTAAAVSKPAAADLTAATISWSLFALFANAAVGNVRSIVSPRVVDQARMRSQNVSGLNSLISLGVVVVCVGLGVLAATLCAVFGSSLWPAAGAFAVLAIGSFAGWMAVLERIDGVAQQHGESLTRALTKV